MSNNDSASSYLDIQHETKLIAQKLDDLHSQFEQLTGSPYTPSSGRTLCMQHSQRYGMSPTGHSVYCGWSDSGSPQMHSNSPACISPVKSPCVHHHRSCRNSDSQIQKQHRWSHCVSPYAVSSSPISPQFGSFLLSKHARSCLSPLNVSPFMKSPTTQDGGNTMTYKRSPSGGRYISFSSRSPKMNYSLQTIAGNCISTLPLSNSGSLTRTKSLPSRIPRPKNLSSNLPSTGNLSCSCNCQSSFAHRPSNLTLTTPSSKSTLHSTPNQRCHHQHVSVPRSIPYHRVSIEDIGTCTPSSCSQSMPAAMSIFDKMNAQAKQDLIRRKRRLSTSTSCLDDDSSEVTRELTIDEIRLPSPEKEFAPEIVSQYTVADMKRLGRRTGRRDPWRC